MHTAMSNTAQDHRILLLDDERDITSVMSVGLKSAGFPVDVFNDPISALSHFEQTREDSPRRYHLVISDIRMPLMSGFDFARRVSALDKDMKIVLITAFEVKKQEFESVLPSLRIDALLNKPIRMTRLNDLVHSLLRSEAKTKATPDEKDSLVRHLD